MHRFYTAAPQNTRRISAHRQTWFESNAITLSPHQKQQTDINIHANDTTPAARWTDPYSAQRASIAVYDLVDAENVRARAIAAAVDGKNIDLARLLSKKDAPIKVISELLQISNIPIEIVIEDNQQVIAKKNGGQPYSIAELSDGERNALLIAANVLTVKEHTLILIDEPERHLHRSIISPLLTNLFAKRSDCAFIVSTHEVMLPIDNPGARILLIRSCAFVGPAVAAFEVDLVSANETIDDQIKSDILGARRTILFTEGTDKSLDKPLYSLVFPNTSVVAKESCRDVERVVCGIRDSDGLHWVRAFGIVDNDGRTQEDIDQLKTKGIYAVPIYSVESIYYHPDVQRRVAERHAAVTGDDAPTRLANAKLAALAAVRLHIPRLSELAALRAIRRRVLGHLPTKEMITEGSPIEISINVAALTLVERERLQAIMDGDDFLAVVSHYPVRETPALTEIAAKLGFRSRDQYEGAVRKLVVDDVEALTFIRSLFGSLAADLAAA